ncbi:MAG TPA: restriction endonuclease [Saprospiraceae bacterium]|nr:restriction endonuclease [Saprospiraceae bacterium]
MGNQNCITVFEHETIRYDCGLNRINEEQFHALERYHGNGVPYFNLCYHGVKFKEFVGVLQIGNTIIEVLPKADNNDRNEAAWRKILIGMLKAVVSFEVSATSESKLNIRPNNILDLYFEMFIKEVEYLLHIGLIKQYRKKEGNVTSLKGNLLFGKHIQQNIVHQERFYVRHTSYDVHHTLHFILYKTIRLLQKINTNPHLHSRIGALLLHFPEMPDVKVSAATFERLVFNRKNQSYKKAIEIAKPLLLQYHPDISKGKNDVLALMFDMNLLWEQFVYVSLRKAKSFGKVESQVPRRFWESSSGSRVTLRPDIVIRYKDEVIVLDTKWKILKNLKPSVEDLRQMFAYGQYFGATQTALVYPGSGDFSRGEFFKPMEDVKDQKCQIITVNVDSDVKNLSENLKNCINSILNISV